MTTYPLSPPQGGFWLGIIFAVPMLFAIPLIHWQHKEKLPRLIGYFVIAASLLALLYFTLAAPLMTNLKVGEGVILVNAPPYAKLEIARHDIKAAYVADWREIKELAPAVKTGGTSIGAYKTGGFRLKNGAGAILVTASSNVLVLEMPERYVMLAPDNFEGFISEFQTKVAPLAFEPPSSSGVPLAKGTRMPLSARMIFTITGLFIILMGYLIRYKKMVNLISGYNEKKVKDKDAVARFMGTFTIGLGVCILSLQFLNISAILVFSFASLPVGIYVLYKSNTL